jgi:hypothetical protein
MLFMAMDCGTVIFGYIVNKKKRVERKSPNHKLLTVDIQILWNNSYNSYVANPALL